MCVVWLTFLLGYGVGVKLLLWLSFGAFLGYVKFK